MKWQPTPVFLPGEPHPWDSPGKNTGVGCHFLLQCVKVKSENEVAQSCLTLATPWPAAYQAPPSMGFSRQEYWSGVPLPSPWASLTKVQFLGVAAVKTKLVPGWGWGAGNDLEGWGLARLEPTAE